MTPSTAVLLAVLAVCAGVLAIAVVASRRTHNAADFLVANRRLGVWLTALGYSGNASSAWFLLIMGAAAFRWGWSAVWIWVAALLGCVINGWYIAPRLRALAVTGNAATLMQVLSADAGDRLQPLLVRSGFLILTVLLIGLMAGMLHDAGEIGAAYLGYSAGTVIVVGAVLVAACMLVGGVFAAGMTDALQMGMALCVALFLLIPVVMLTNGWHALAVAFQSLGPAATDPFGGRHGVVALAFAAGVSGLGLSMTGQVHAVGRYLAVRDEAALRGARWLALVWTAVMFAAMLACGWGARVLYDGLTNPLHAPFAIASRILPPSLAAVLMVPLLAAVVLGIAGPLLTIAASASVDLKRTTVPVALLVTRATLAGAATLAVVIALYGRSSLLDQAVFAYTALGAAFGPLLLVCLSGKRIRPGSALGAMWAGFTLSLLFHLLPDSPGDFLERVLPFVAALGIALTGGERRRNPDRADRSQETVHDRVAI